MLRSIGKSLVYPGDLPCARRCRCPHSGNTTGTQMSEGPQRCRGCGVRFFLLLSLLERHPAYADVSTNACHRLSRRSPVTAPTTPKGLHLGQHQDLTRISDTCDRSDASSLFFVVLFQLSALARVARISLTLYEPRAYHPNLSSLSQLSEPHPCLPLAVLSVPRPAPPPLLPQQPLRSQS